MRDFMTIYNKMSEQCFANCVNDLGQRKLSNDECVCVDRCVTKGIRVIFCSCAIFLVLGIKHVAFADYHMLEIAQTQNLT